MFVEFDKVLTCYNPLKISSPNDGDSTNQKPFLIYPNPTSGNIKIRIIDKGMKYPFLISIFDIAGKEIIHQSFSNEEGFINCSKFGSGIYLISIVDNDTQIWFNKLIKVE